MTLPKKKRRRLVVDDVGYTWMVSNREPKRLILTIQREDTGALVRAKLQSDLPSGHIPVLKPADVRGLIQWGTREREGWFQNKRMCLREGIEVGEFMTVGAQWPV